MQRQKGTDQGFKLCLAFNHRPVTTIGEDMYFAMWNQAHGQQTDIHRAYPVISSPGQ